MEKKITLAGKEYLAEVKKEEGKSIDIVLCNNLDLGTDITADNAEAFCEDMLDLIYSEGRTLADEQEEEWTDEHEYISAEITVFVSGVGRYPEYISAFLGGRRGGALHRAFSVDIQEKDEWIYPDEEDEEEQEDPAAISYNSLIRLLSSYESDKIFCNCSYSHGF